MTLSYALPVYFYTVLSLLFFFILSISSKVKILVNTVSVLLFLVLAGALACSRYLNGLLNKPGTELCSYTCKGLIILILHITMIARLCSAIC